MPQHNGSELSQEMLECIQNCMDCARTCTMTLNYCIEQGGRHVEPNHLRLMMDCIDICTTSANFMMRGSQMHHLTCGACAEVCERCAEDCEHMADDQRMAACAQMCRKCAESCHAMAGAHAGH